MIGRNVKICFYILHLICYFYIDSLFGWNFRRYLIHDKHSSKYILEFASANIDKKIQIERYATIQFSLLVFLRLT